MNTLEFTGVVGLGSLLAGFLGALTGLGGGVVVVPMLTLLFHVDIRYAIGASLVSVIATSSGAAAAYVREGYSNIRIGMFLEIATTAERLPAPPSRCMFPRSPLPWSSAWSCCIPRICPAGIARNTRPHLQSSKLADEAEAERHAIPRREEAAYTSDRRACRIRPDVRRGRASGLLGIGSGAVKVLAMDQAMKIPFKVSTTTSNFMIGVTAAASAGLYLSRGYIAPAIAMPVVLGVLAGSMIGAKVLVKANVKALRYLFAAVILILGVEMIVSGATGKL